MSLDVQWRGAGTFLRSPESLEITGRIGRFGGFGIGMEEFAANLGASGVCHVCRRPGEKLVWLAKLLRGSKARSPDSPDFLEEQRRLVQSRGAETPHYTLRMWKRIASRIA